MQACLASETLSSGSRFNLKEPKMTVFIVSFRIADVKTSLGSYDDRWESVDTAIREHGDGLYWNETTSFYAVSSSRTSSADMAEAIDGSSLFDPTVDLLLVVNLSQKGFKLLGKNQDPDLDYVMQRR